MTRKLGGLATARASIGAARSAHRGDNGPAFAILCQVQSRLVYLARTLKQQEHKSLLDEGRASAYATMERQYYQVFRQYAGEFGLTPRARVGLAIGGKDEDDEIAGLLN